MRAPTRLVFTFVLGALPCQAAPAAKTAAACENERAALGGIACEVGRALAAQAANAVVVGLAPTLSPSTPLVASVAVRLAVETALALGGGASAWPLAEDRARLPHFSSPRPLVVIQPRLQGDALESAIELFAPSTTGATSGAPAPRLDPIVRFAVRRPLDAEVRRFLPPVSIAAREFVRLGPADNDVVALACGDLDGTGVSTIASIGRTYVTFGTYVAGKYTPTSRREQRELAPIAATPLREPIGAAWITPSRALEFGVTDRAHALRLRSGSEPEALSARLPWPGGGCVDLEPPLVAASAVRCKKDAPVLAAPALTDALDALAGAAVVSRTGVARLVRAGRRASDGSVSLTDGSHDIRLEHAGAQLAVADLDGDGNPELVTSIDTLDPRADGVVIYSWLGSSLNERLRVAVPAGVHALAVCPMPAERMASVVVATSVGLWVIR
jgi:hypothetical protein